MSNEVINPFQRFRDANGIALAAGTISFFDNKTTDLATIFSDEALTVAQTNPYTLDSSGRIAGDVKYRGIRTLLIKDSSGATVRTIDDVRNAFSAADTSITKSTIAAAKADDNLANFVGGYVRVAEYAAGVPIDALYLIVAGHGTDDLGGVLNSDTGTLFNLQLIVENSTVTVGHFGAGQSGASDDSQRVINALAFTSIVEFDGSKTYNLDSKITIPSNKSIYLNGCSINTDLDDHLFESIGTAGTPIENIRIFGPCRATATTIGGGAQQFFHGFQSRDVHLTDQIYMKDFGGTGVKFNEGCSDCSATHCIADGIGVISFYAESNGADGANILTSNIRYTHNHVKNFNYGIEMKQVAGAIINSNIIEDGKVGADKYGILVTRDFNQGGFTDQFAPTRVIISDNIVRNTDTLQFGINITAGYDCIIANNIVHDVGDQGITASGSHITVDGNMVNNVTDVSISANFNPNVLGTNGAPASYDEAYHTVTNNTVKDSTSIPYNFNDCKESVISDNKNINHLEANFAYSFRKCQNSAIMGNKNIGGISSFSFRIEDDENDNLLWVDNAGPVDKLGDPLSKPSTFTGFYTKRDDGFSWEEVRFLQTTDATPTTIASATLGNDQAVSIKQHSVVRNNSIRHDKESHAFVNRAGAAAAALTGTDTTIHDHNNTGGSAVINTVATNDAIVQVTGVAAQTMSWRTEVIWTRAV